MNSKVTDLAPLKGAAIQTLWLNGSPVKDLGPLVGSAVVSLSIDDTKVEDVEALRGSMVERLSMARCKVADLSPLGGVPLTRLVFSPGSASKGMDEVRGIKTMQEIGLDFEKRLKPAEFWKAYDAGQLGERK